MSAPAFRIEPASADHFDDVSIMLAPTRPGTTACWCLSHRIDPAVNRELGPDARPGYMRRLCRQPVAPGVLAHDVDEVVGWASVAPRAGVYSIARNSRIPKLDDDLAIWSIWCLKVRAGHCGRGWRRR
ncbi:hypothetical protein ABZ815_50800 [Nonomuraea sp. NPDC047529]|uniref:hypothetical protein n=1 Tax=Nonomuraea sp. NPDC047529 TaxID=3155623 RepID=UPI0033BFF535